MWWSRSPTGYSSCSGRWHRWSRVHESAAIGNYRRWGYSHRHTILGPAHRQEECPARQYPRPMPTLLPCLHCRRCLPRHCCCKWQRAGLLCWLLLLLFPVPGCHMATGYMTIWSGCMLLSLSLGKMNSLIVLTFTSCKVTSIFSYGKHPCENVS